MDIMEEMKIGFNCCLIADICAECFFNCLLSSPPPSIKMYASYSF